MRDFYHRHMLDICDFVYHRKEIFRQTLGLSEKAIFLQIVQVFLFDTIHMTNYQYTDCLL